MKPFHLFLLNYKQSIFTITIRFKEEGEIKYKKAAAELESPERSTLEVSFDDIERYNQVLSTTIIEEYYRFVDKNISTQKIQNTFILNLQWY